MQTRPTRQHSTVAATAAVARLAESLLVAMAAAVRAVASLVAVLLVAAAVEAEAALGETVAAVQVSC